MGSVYSAKNVLVKNKSGTLEIKIFIYFLDEIFMKDESSEITFCLICKNKFKLTKIIDLSDEDEVKSLITYYKFLFKSLGRLIIYATHKNF